MKKIVLLVLFALLPLTLFAENIKYSQQQLDQMMAPIALYPDALLSQVLMASTYPDQLQAAIAWSSQHPNLQGQAAADAASNQQWDPSVTSLVAFPQILSMMSQRPDWVQEMGDAFLSQPNSVMDTVQQLRARAQNAGTLQSTQQQQVVMDNSNGYRTITIIPTSPDTIYVPIYDPRYAYGTWMYPDYEPYYYYPSYYRPTPGVFIGFAFAVIAGDILWGGFNWHHHDIYIDTRRYNSFHPQRRIYVQSQRASWTRDIRPRHENFVARPQMSYQRDMERHNAQVIMQRQVIHSDHANHILKEKHLDLIK